MSAAVMTQGLDFGATATEKRDFASKLRQQTIACRVRHEKLGVRKALTKEQLRRAADEFGAESEVLTAAKRILDTKDPSYRAVQKIRRRATQYWKAVSTPFPEPGVRLIRRSAVEAFTRQMEELKLDLHNAAAALQLVYSDLRAAAQEKLGDLFNAADYPARVDTEFALEWDFPSIEPPAYLKDIHPELYEQECARIKGRFEEAVRLTEQAFTVEFQKLVSHLTERLKGDVDGKPKVFRDTAVENLSSFFEQFRQLDIGASGSLQALVDQAQEVVKGITPDDLRGSQDTRARVAAQLGEITAAMDELMVNKPKRAIDLEDAQ